MLKKLKPMQYDLETYRRSNQDTCLVHKPALSTGEWVESGDLLADSSASKNGELALGKNILVAYMPWEGYNYEDAILINERLVYDDAYTSVHIERYEIETKDNQSDVNGERITRTIPDLKPEHYSHLDNYGIAKIGSWIEEGDILVGKVTPVNPKKQTGYQKLILKLFEKKANTVRDTSLRAPKGIRANVIDVQILGYTVKAEPSKQPQKEKKLLQSSLGKPNATTHLTKNKFPGVPGSNRLKNTEPVRVHGTRKNKLKTFNSKWLRDDQNTVFQKTTSSVGNLSCLSQPVVSKNFGFKKHFDATEAGNFTSTSAKYISQRKEIFYNTGYAPLPALTTPKISIKKGSRSAFAHRTKNQDAAILFTNNKAKSLVAPVTDLLKKKTPKIVPTIVHIYLAEKRKIQVGDKMAGRHGNKGIISNILPRQDMPYLPDGTALDIVLNPLGVPSRMNVGQIYECLLGLAGKYLGEHYKITPFDEMYGAEASRSFVFSKLFEASKKTGIEWLFDPNSPGKMRIFDGRTAECYDQPVTVGIAYMLKLVHMVDDKLHARSTGPYSLVTQQPLRGRAKQGGQRLGEMEVWAIEGYGAAFVLLEMLTLKSDDMTGRLKLWSDLILNKNITLGTPESFKVLVCELQALCLDIGLFRATSTPKQERHQIKNSVSGKQTKSLQLKEISNLMFLP